MQKQAFNFLSEMRIDLPHFLMIQDSVLFDQNSQIQIQQGLNSYILNGFNIATPWAAGNPASSLQVVVSGSGVALAQDIHGSFLLIPAGTPNEQLTSANTNVVGSFTPNSTNYVSVQFQRFADPTTSDLVAFWDEDAGQEFTQTVPLGLVLNYQFAINTTGFGSNAPICTVQTDAFNNILSITNCKQNLNRLGSGGSTPDPFHSWTYAASPENPLTATSSAVDPFANNGDWELAYDKKWKDAVMSAIKQMRNTAYWYVNGSTMVPNVNLVDLFFDTDDSVLTMRGKFIHSQSTPGMLTWSGQLNIRGIIGPLTYIIPAGTVTLSDTQVAYVELVRNQDFQPSNSFTFTNGSTAVTATIPILSINPGDWIIYAADNIGDWAQVDTVSGSNITLVNPYEGSTATGKALRAQGSYTMQTANPSAVPATSDSFWIAKRDDNGTITATIAAAPTGAVRTSDITTFSTTAPHGINAGQGVQTAGVVAALQTISAIARVSNVVTATTASAHGYTVGQLITIAGVTDSSYDGAFNIVSVPTATTFTYSQVGVNSSSSGGTASDNTTFNQFFEVLTVPTTSTFTVQNSGSNATGGGGTVSSTATIYLRGIGTVSQGESSSDDSSAIEALIQYTGAAYAGDTQPQYDSDNYVTQGLDLTGAIGQLDARAGVSANISDQDRNLKLILGGTWSATVASGTASFASYTPSIDTNDSISVTTTYQDQSFTTTASGALAQLIVTLYKTGSPTGNAFVQIQTDNAGAPSGTVVATSNPLDVSTFATNYPTVSATTVTFTSSPTLANSTVYHIVLVASGVTFSGGTIFFGANDTNGYAGGQAQISTDSGVTWTPISGGIVDIYFNIEYSLAGTATLTNSSTAYVQVPSLADAVNTIAAQTINFSAPDQVAYVEVNRAGSGGTLAVNVALAASVTMDDNTLVVARFCSDSSVIVGTHSFRLVNGESKELDAGLSVQNRTFIGATDEADSQPQYSSHAVVANDDPLNIAIGKLDNILSDLTPKGVLIGQGESTPISTVAPGSSGNVLTSNGTDWVSASGGSTEPASYELLNLGLAAAVGSGNLTVALKQMDGATDPATGPNSVKIGFRSAIAASGQFYERTVTTALSVTAPNGASLGTASGINQNLFVYAVDDAGTVQLALAGSRAFDEGTLQDIELLTAGGSAVLAQDTSGGNVQISASSSVFYGQIFVPTATGFLNSAVVGLSTNGGLTGNITMELHADSGGSPGTLLETSTALNSATITSIQTPYTFTFSGATSLISGTTYHLVINVSGVTYSGFVLDFEASTPNTYPSGSAETSSDGGATWSTLSSYSLYFVVNGTEPASSDPYTLYSSSALSGVAVRLIGRLVVNEATAGDWVTSPSGITTQPFKIGLPVKASYYMSTNMAASSGNQINFDAVIYDPYNTVVTGATWAFTAPMPGLYLVTVVGETVAGALSNFIVYKNGTGFCYADNVSGGTSALTCAIQIQLNAGDYIDYRPNSNTFSIVGTGMPYITKIDIARLSD